MTNAIAVVGLLPYGVPAVGSGGFLTANSFGAPAGECVMCFGHWAGKGPHSEYTFWYSAQWKVGEAGVVVRHWLNPALPGEVEVAQAIARGELFLSHGMHDNRFDLQRTVERFQAEVLPGRTYKVRALDYGTPGHIAYVTTPAIRQEPVRLVEPALVNVA